MSKVSFRTRQIDYNRTLSIVKYDSEAFQELGEGSFVNRGAPTVPSGMEREEENVIKARTSFRTYLFAKFKQRHRFLSTNSFLFMGGSPGMLIPPTVNSGPVSLNRVSNGFCLISMRLPLA